jgi:hypothetical protein
MKYLRKQHLADCAGSRKPSASLSSERLQLTQQAHEISGGCLLPDHACLAASFPANEPAVTSQLRDVRNNQF